MATALTILSQIDERSFSKMSMTSSRLQQCQGIFGSPERLWDIDHDMEDLEYPNRSFTGNLSGLFMGGSMGASQ